MTAGTFLIGTELLGSGFTGELAYVATQSDVFTRSELIDNLPDVLHAESTPLECAVARNDFTKKFLTKDLCAAASSPCIFPVPSLYLPCTFPVPSLYLPCTFPVPSLYLPCAPPPRRPL